MKWMYSVQNCPYDGYLIRIQNVKSHWNLIPELTKMLWPMECNWFLGISSWEHLSCRLSSLEAWHHNSAMRSTSPSWRQALELEENPELGRSSWMLRVRVLLCGFMLFLFCLHFVFFEGFLQGTSCGHKSVTVCEDVRLLFFNRKFILKGSLTNTS